MSMATGPNGRSSRPTRIVPQKVEVERKPAAESRKELYTWAEPQQHWTPFNKAVSPKEADRCHWKAETGTVQTYQHVETGRYIHIDVPSGQFYDRHKNPIGAKEGLDRAMPVGRQHSHLQEASKTVGRNAEQRSIQHVY